MIIYFHSYGNEEVLGSTIQIISKKDTYEISLHQESFYITSFKDLSTLFIKAIISKEVNNSIEEVSEILNIYIRDHHLVLNKSLIPNNPTPEELFLII